MERHRIEAKVVCRVEKASHVVMCVVGEGGAIRHLRKAEFGT